MSKEQLAHEQLEVIREYAKKVEKSLHMAQIATGPRKPGRGPNFSFSDGDEVGGSIVVNESGSAGTSGGRGIVAMLNGGGMEDLLMKR